MNVWYFLINVNVSKIYFKGIIIYYKNNAIYVLRYDDNTLIPSKNNKND